MKQVIRIIDNITKKGRSKEGGDVIEIEKTLRDLDHFEAQRKFRAQVFVDRRKRKPKYKKNYLEED